MITTSELHRTAALEGIRFDQAEKDYAILWILYGLSQPNLLSGGWVLKGGTCLRHCYYSGYRFSEDLDFSCDSAKKGLEEAQILLSRVANWIRGTSGIHMETKKPHTIPGDFQMEIPLEYNRGGYRRQKLPSVKIHLTFDEPIFTKVTMRSVNPQYSDLPHFKITAYSKEEILTEKMRALLQQQRKWPRPRDLYDLWFILCRSREHFESEALKNIFVQKCQVRGISPDLFGLISENLREWNEGGWENILRPLMKTVPEFDVVWREWTTIFHELFG